MAGMMNKEEWVEPIKSRKVIRKLKKGKFRLKFRGIRVDKYGK